MSVGHNYKILLLLILNSCHPPPPLVGKDVRAYRGRFKAPLAITSNETLLSLRLVFPVLKLEIKPHVSIPEAYDQETDSYGVQGPALHRDG